MSNGSVVFIVTAGNCGVCKTIKNNGVLQKLIDHLKSLGCQVADRYVPSMDTEINTGSKMDAVLNKLFRAWFPMFICMSKNIVTLVESSQQVSLTDVIASASVFNGLYSQSKGSYDIDRKYNSLDTSSFSSWITAVLASKEFAHGAALGSKPEPVVQPIGRSLLPPMGVKNVPTATGPMISGGQLNIMGSDSDIETATCDRIRFPLKSRYHS